MLHNASCKNIQIQKNLPTKDHRFHKILLHLPKRKIKLCEKIIVLKYETGKGITYTPMSE